MISDPQLHTFVTTSRQGGQLPKWHFKVHWCPQGSFLWQGPLQVGWTCSHLMGGSIFAPPQGQYKGWFDTNLHYLQNPRWQKLLHVCFPQANILLHVLRHKCLPDWSYAPFTGQQSSLHLCFLQDMYWLQTLLHLKVSISSCSSGVISLCFRCSG